MSLSWASEATDCVTLIQQVLQQKRAAESLTAHDMHIFQIFAWLLTIGIINPSQCLRLGSKAVCQLAECCRMSVEYSPEASELGCIHCAVPGACSRASVHVHLALRSKVLYERLHCEAACQDNACPCYGSCCPTFCSSESQRPSASSSASASASQAFSSETTASAAASSCRRDCICSTLWDLGAAIALP